MFIHCANCAHCRSQRQEVWRDKRSEYVGELRVWCAKGHWPRESCCWHTVISRTMIRCADFDPMGDDPKDEKEFLADLHRSLPHKRVFTSPPKGVVLIKNGAA